MSAGKGTRAAQPQLGNFVGTPQDLPLADLPTRRNVLQKMMWEKLNDPRDHRNIPIMELAGKTGRAVIAMWTKMNREMTRSLVKEKEVVRRIFMLWTRMDGVASGGKRRLLVRGKSVGRPEKRERPLWPL